MKLLYFLIYIILFLIIICCILHHIYIRTHTHTFPKHKHKHIFPKHKHKHTHFSNIHLSPFTCHHSLSCIYHTVSHTPETHSNTSHTRDTFYTTQPSSLQQLSHPGCTRHRVLHTPLCSAL